MRVFLGMLLLMGFTAPGYAQQPSQPPQKNLADDEPIVVTGLADGARVVEVDFDKVWKNCAECKRALAKLDKLAQGYRDELKTAGYFAAGGGHCGGARPSGTTSFQRSSAQSVDAERRTPQSLVGSLCAERRADTSKRTYEAMAQQYVVPEQAKLFAHLRSFLDQLAPHLKEATEAERIEHRASAGLTDTKRTKLSARNLKRIDVTSAVIRRLDAKDFTIVLPDPPAPGPARGGYDPPQGKRR